MKIYGVGWVNLNCEGKRYSGDENYPRKFFLNKATAEQFIKNNQDPWTEDWELYEIEVNTD